MIRPYTVILAHRRLNSLPTAKDEPYLYRKEELDLKGLTKEELGNRSNVSDGIVK